LLFGLFAAQASATTIKVKYDQHWPDLKVAVDNHWPDCKIKFDDHWPDVVVVQDDYWPDIKVKEDPHWPDIKVKEDPHWPDVKVSGTRDLILAAVACSKAIKAKQRAELKEFATFFGSIASQAA